MENETDRSRTIEQLEGIEWPDPPSDGTGLVKAVHNLRKRPINLLTAWEMSRLIGQDVGIPWLLPVALEILRETATDQPLGGFYDDDLLTAVLTRRSPIWQSNPQWAANLKEVISLLEDISPNTREDVRSFFLEAETKASN
ncbi:contact-dependent growth inhibition system immunity protein [Streptomyces sp. PTY087I2]|uniref:contact-dependent growth inhibition system immunity protein n=1 Tax=Streptomyces sp. PTY087I2 TaxID=1819298 RepID=UPI00114CD7C0|nr:contact-dependent growth inhibition system immunity protein [Streptomyces sp. PTY087I2]